MSYTLHYAPDNASLIIRLALEHLGLPYRSALVDRAAQAQRAPAFLALNPNGVIPVLETPDGPMFETGAILLWLGDKHGGLGPDATRPTRSDYLKWLFFISNTLHPALRMMFYPEKFIGTDLGGQMALRQHLQAQIKANLRLLDDLATDTHKAFGTDLPLGLRIYIAACLRWCALYPVDYDRSWFSLADTPALAKICADLETLPCVHALQSAEGLGDTPFTSPRYAHPPEGSAT